MPNNMTFNHILPGIFIKFFKTLSNLFAKLEMNFQLAHANTSYLSEVTYPIGIFVTALLSK